MQRVGERARELAADVARRLASEPGFVVRSYGPGRYLIGGGDKAIVVVAGDGLEPEALRRLADEIAWRAGSARVHLVVTSGSLDPDRERAFAELASAPRFDLTLISADRSEPSSYGLPLPSDHALTRALLNKTAPEAVGERTAGMRLADALARGGRPWVTIALIVMNVIVFLYLSFNAAWDWIPALVGFGANAPALLREGEWWRLGTAMFVHVGPIHLGFNMWALWVLGSFFERLVGAAPVVVIYLLSGLFASATSAYAHEVVSAGASGAIFGVFGLFAAVAWRPRGIVHPLIARALLRNVIMLLALNMFIGVVVPQIDLAAHLGGFVLGFLLALALPFSQRERGGAPRWLRTAGAVSLLALVATFAGNLYAGTLYVRGEDLGVPVERAAGGVALELPRKLHRKPLPGGRPGARFERRYAGLARVTVATASPREPVLLHALNLEWFGHVPDAAELTHPGSPIEQGGKKWLTRIRTFREHGIEVRSELYRTVVGGLLVQLEFDVLAADAQRYHHVITHALWSLHSLPGEAGALRTDPRWQLRVPTGTAHVLPPRALPFPLIGPRIYGPAERPGARSATATPRSH